MTNPSYTDEQVRDFLPLACAGDCCEAKEYHAFDAARERVERALTAALQHPEGARVVDGWRPMLLPSLTNDKPWVVVRDGENGRIKYLRSANHTYRRFGTEASAQKVADGINAAPTLAGKDG